MNPAGESLSTSRLPMLLFIAWRNIWRSPVRSFLTIAALAGGLVHLIAKGMEMRRHQGLVIHGEYQFTGLRVYVRILEFHAISRPSC